MNRQEIEVGANQEAEAIQSQELTRVTLPVNPVTLPEANISNVVPSHFSNVVNLSSRVLTYDEYSVLSKGLNFCPTPSSIDRFRIKRDVAEFGRTLKCKFYVHGKSYDGSTSKFKKKSTWTPPVSEPAFDLFPSELERRLRSIDEGGRNYGTLSQGKK